MKLNKSSSVDELIWRIQEKYSRTNPNLSLYTLSVKILTGDSLKDVREYLKDLQVEFNFNFSLRELESINEIETEYEVIISVEKTLEEI